MTDQLPPCPLCSSELSYEMGPVLVCPECAHEWTSTSEVPTVDALVRDAVGNVLADGDTASVP